MTSAHVLVFGRHPEADAPKRRLVPRVGDDGARALHRAFLRDTLDAVRGAGLRVALAHTPGPPFPEAQAAELALVQVGSDFGERLDRALAEAAAALGGPQLLVGVDTPHLGPEGLAAALAALEADDAAVGLSPRGGFHLLALRGPAPSIREVFAGPGEGPALVRLLERRGLSVSHLPGLTDVDLPGDLDELAAALAKRRARRVWRPLATERALAELGLSGGDPR